VSGLPDLAGALPAPARLRQRLRALTVLEACFQTGWPRYAFGVTGAFDQFTYENGGGDDYRVFFGDRLTFLRVFDHESPMSPYVNDEVWPGLLDGLPAGLEPLTRLADDEDYPSITLALWHDGEAWRHGDPEPSDGGEADLTDWILAPLLQFTPAGVAGHMADFYSRQVDEDAVAALMRGDAVDRLLVNRLNPEADWDHVTAIARELDKMA